MTDSARLKDRVAIVTGASSGIGAATCRSLVALGMQVVGVARRADKIEAIAKEVSNFPGSLTAIKCDMTKDDQVQNMFKHVVNKYGAVHVCINNAGYCAGHSLLEGNLEEWRGMLDVNVVSVCLLTKLAVNSMREKGIDDGHIIHISSMAGHRIVASTPATHFYTATKFALRALTEGLRQELRAVKSHIRVTSISPGIVETEFASVMLQDEAKAQQLYSSLECLKSEDIAASVVHTLTAPSHVEINDILIRPTEQAS